MGNWNQGVKGHSVRMVPQVRVWIFYIADVDRAALMNMQWSIKTVIMWPLTLNLKSSVKSSIAYTTAK